MTRFKPEHKELQSIGINPNLNFENEYIENLLQQIHFLSLEAKLLKEKQAEHKSTGILGILSKESIPPVEHVFHSNMKFKDMKGELTNTLNRLDIASVRLEDENLALRAKKYFLKKMHEEEEEKERGRQAETERTIKDLYGKLAADKARIDELTAEIEANRKKVNEEEQQVSKIRKNLEVKAINEKIDQMLFSDENEFESRERTHRRDEIGQFRTIIE